MAALNVFGSKPAGLTAFKRPEINDDDRFSFADHIGQAAIFDVKGVEDHPTGEVDDRTGEIKRVLRCNYIVVLGDKPQKYTDAIVWNPAPRDLLAPSAGQGPTVALLTQRKSKAGFNYNVVDDATPAAIAAAEKYLAEDAK